MYQAFLILQVCPTRVPQSAYLPANLVNHIYFYLYIEMEDADELPQPQVSAGEAITELEAVVDSLKDILEQIELNGNEG